jgi:hypothetical protein
VFKDVIAAVGMKDAKNFRKDIRRHYDLQRSMERRGIWENKSGERGFAFAPVLAEGDDGSSRFPMSATTPATRQQKTA